MKTANPRGLQKKIKSQQDQAVSKRRGKPPVVVGVERKEREDVVLQNSSTFWNLIEERRKESTMSMKELRTRLKKRKK
jgi:hypothetical protein